MDGLTWDSTRQSWIAATDAGPTPGCEFFPSGAELLFCRRHERQYEKKLFELATVVERSP